MLQLVGINGAMASTTDKDKSIDPVNKSW
jgi:hypothetical protein